MINRLSVLICPKCEMYEVIDTDPKFMSASLDDTCGLCGAALHIEAFTRDFFSFQISNTRTGTYGMGPAGPGPAAGAAGVTIQFTKHHKHTWNGIDYFEPHKHIWDEVTEDKEIYIPEDIDPGTDVSTQFLAFCNECNIEIKGGYQTFLFEETRP